MSKRNKIRKEYLSATSIVYTGAFNGEVYNVCDRFMSYAMYLKADETLGLEVTMEDGESCKNYIYLDSDKETSIEEFDWIFSDYAKVVPEKHIISDQSQYDNRVNYKLETLKYSNDAERRKQVIYEICKNEYFQTMCEEIRDAQGNIRIMMKACDGNNQNVGSVIFSFPQKISKKLKTVITMVFQDSILNEIDEDTITSGIGKEEMRDYIIVLLKVLESEQNKDSDSIDNLNLGVRSYNVLKKAKINTISTLMGMRDEELLSIKNLGRKQLEEIKEKLSDKFCIQLDDDFGKEYELYLESENIVEDIPQIQKPNYMEQLQNLIGIKSAKEQARRILAFAKMRKIMQEKGEQLDPITLNMEFIGNPGTAKTTVARIMAGVLSEMGIIKNENLIEVGRADLIAQYVGQTGPKVKTAFNKAKGGVLFIDEAYSLLEYGRGGYGDEAINVIVQEMENNRQDTIVIFAGYPNEMEKFFSRNPGLRSRVPFTLKFDDFSVDELMDICELEASKRKFSIDTKANDKLREMCEYSKRNIDNGNGRFCRNIIEKAILNFALRNYGCDEVNENIEYILKKEDFLDITVLDCNDKDRTLPIGFQVSAS